MARERAKHVSSELAAAAIVVSAGACRLLMSAVFRPPDMAGQIDKVCTMNLGTSLPHF